PVELLRLRGLVDCLVPRGGPSLVKAVLENATVPYVIDGDGNCHVYVDAAADLDMALAIVVNAKTQRPSVCNAAESLLVHEAVAETFLPRAAVVMVNASTRFTDGEEFGYGAEIGISTQKLHARGPMGLHQLTTLKYVVEGSGQIRT